MITHGLMMTYSLDTADNIKAFFHTSHKPSTSTPAQPDDLAASAPLAYFLLPASALFSIADLCTIDNGLFLWPIGSG